MGLPTARLVPALAAATAALLAAAALALLTGGEEAPRSLEAQACGLGDDRLSIIRAGVHPVRSGEVLLATDSRIYIDPGDGPGGPPGMDGQVSPVPLVFYGPGRIASRGPVPDSATHADIAPTIARLLKGSVAADGSPLPAVARLDAKSIQRRSPRLIVTVTWRAGGWNVLEQWPGDWPNLLRIIEGGVSYDGGPGTVAAGPEVSAATIATGRWPATHGITDEIVRRPEGELVPAGRAEVLTQTLTQRWQRQQPAALTGSLPIDAALRGWSASDWGSDRVTDLLTVFDDAIAEAVAANGVDSEETNAAVVASDARLGDLLEVLDGDVGRGRYVLVLTADGGRHLGPDDVPTVAIPARLIADAIEQEFGPVVEAVTPTQVFLEPDLPKELSASEVGVFLARLTVAEVAEARVADELGDSQVFDVAVPKTRLGELRCDTSAG